MKLLRFELCMSRSSDISGVFVVNDEQWESLCQLNGNKVYLGEVAGKHSEVSFDFDVEDIEVLCEDNDFITKMVSMVGGNFGFDWSYYLLVMPLERAYEEGYEDGCYNYTEESVKEIIDDYCVYAGKLREEYANGVADGVKERD